MLLCAIADGAKNATVSSDRAKCLIRFITEIFWLTLKFSSASLTSYVPNSTEICRTIIASDMENFAYEILDDVMRACA